MGKQTKTSDWVLQIMKQESLGQLQSSIIVFLDFINANEKYKNQMCRQLIQLIIEFGNQYLKLSPLQDKNIVLIPQEAAPILMITTCVPITDDAGLIIEGLNKFVARCGEFSEPQEDIISADEINMILDIAQRKFNILNIIAPDKPLKILHLNNSHCIHNCECGIGESPMGQEAVIFVYHPIDVSMFDRVYIFAHELGHALHLALTGTVEVVPDDFDAFNESLGIKGLTIEEKQETFADAMAIAILNCDELKGHFPAGLLEELPPYVEKYIIHITNKYFKAHEGMPF